MSRLSFRPRPLDIHKKLPIIKSIKEFDDDEIPASTRNSQLLRAVPEIEHEVWTLPGVLSLHHVFPLFCLLTFWYMPLCWLLVYGLFVSVFK